jgi:ParB family chromosome partitioning protein
MFDIDFDDGAEAPQPVAPESRRGPMASAIAENAEAVSQRQATEAAIRSENDALAHELVRLRKAGLITDAVPLDAIRTDKLKRDRKPGRDDEIDELKTSIRAVGLSNPIRLELVGEGYELIQGYRRLLAYRELRDETGGDAAYARIPAVLVAKGEAQLRLYRQMVDENLVRRGVTFGELAALAIGYKTAEPHVESYDQAVELLYASASRQKRAYIKAFARLIVRLAPHLLFPESLPRSLGLEVLKRIDDDRDATRRLTQMLAARVDRDAEAEVAVMQAFLDEPAAPSVPKPAPRKAAKTTFRVARPEGLAKCTASDGCLELRLDRDFSEVERARLERAVTAFFDALDG